MKPIGSFARRHELQCRRTRRGFSGSFAPSQAKPSAAWPQKSLQSGSRGSVKTLSKSRTRSWFQTGVGARHSLRIRFVDDDSPAPSLAIRTPERPSGSNRPGGSCRAGEARLLRSDIARQASTPSLHRGNGIDTWKFSTIFRPRSSETIFSLTRKPENQRFSGFFRGASANGFLLPRKLNRIGTPSKSRSSRRLLTRYRP